jgi:uncharacterized membrane protein
MKAKVVERSQQSQSQKKRQIKGDFLIYFFAIILTLAVFFRFANLDVKAYWGDETVTSLRVSGHTLAELKQLAFQGEEISVAEIQNYQYPNPEKNILDTITGLATEEPQHPPLYFVLVKLWVQLFGNSIAVTRSFSAVLSLLALPCIYWLAQELFNSPLTGGVAITLMAVSPFQVLYAQEARSSSFWTVTILLSSAALLRAKRVQTKISWILYALTLTIGFYTFVLSGTIAIAHGIYLIINEGFKLTKSKEASSLHGEVSSTKTIRNYFISLVVSFILFIPWIIAVLTNFSEADATTSWTKATVSLQSLTKTWLLNLSRSFIDFNYNFVTRNLLMYAIIAGLVILVAYSIYFLCRHTQQQVWLFVLTLTIVPALILVIPDLIFGGIRSSVARYAIPCFLGMQITVAYMLASQMTSAVSSQWRQQIWRVVSVILISGSIASCVTISQAQIWWNKYNAATLPEVAKIVNQAANPVFITSWHGLMAFSHAFDPKVKFYPVERQPIALSDEENSDIFVYESANVLKALTENKQKYQIAQKYEWKKYIEPVYEVRTTLWKLEKRSL